RGLDYYRYSLDRSVNAGQTQLSPEAKSEHISKQSRTELNFKF
ncbi:15251_t:CDS:1, partial [Racocetra persica]